MKGKTAFQKIVDSHLVKTLPDGRMVLKLDWVWGHEITTPNAILDMQARGCDVIFNPNKIKIMIDHVNPAKDTASAIQGKIVREWSKRHSIEFLDVGRNGVCHAIIPEKGWILPGQIGIMGDSHTCTHGAFCAFTVGVGTTELENGIITGLWTCPPQKVIRVNFTGKLPANVFAKDLILTLINKIGVKGATNAVLEFGGNVIDEMSMESRMTITNMAVEAGATSGMMMVDKKTINYLWSVWEKRYRPGWDEYPWNSDPDAEYDQRVEIDVSDMRPVMTFGYSPANVINVGDFKHIYMTFEGRFVLDTEKEIIEANIYSWEKKNVNQVYIGSCTNGRLSDLRIAASVIKLMGGKISDNVRCIVVPATQHIYKRALQEGLIEIFLNAGCFVSGPTCGACLGMSCGVQAPGEVCVSTTNRNFPGRMGKDGMVHLASPATAAISAIEGKITEPTKHLCMWIIDDICKSNPSESRVVPSGWEEKESKQPDYANLLVGIGGGQQKDFSGKVFYLPVDNVDTDQIIPAKYLTETKKEEFGKHCLEDAPISAEDRTKLYQSQILVAGENFGCGSSREHAPWALEAAGIKCVIAPSFARIFYENMFANGLLCIELPKDVIQHLCRIKPNRIEVDLENNEVSWQDNFTPQTLLKGSGPLFLSDYQKTLIRNGGSVGVMLKLAAELQAEGKI